MKEKEKEKVLSHLKRYKADTLKITECGRWCKGQKKYPHILPKAKEDMNIIEIYRKNLLGKIPQARKHRGFSHLNSSQALTLNLFGPLVVENCLHKIASVFQVDSLRGTGDFEVESDLGDGTFFDFAVKDGERFIFTVEVKYTEERFSGAKNDRAHHKKYRSFYQANLGAWLNGPIPSIVDFLKDYQIWRNIICSNEGVVAFVFPKTRLDLQKKIEAIKGMLKKTLVQKVRIVYIEDIVAEVEKRCLEDDNGEKLKAHYREFREKYFGEGV